MTVHIPTFPYPPAADFVAALWTRVLQGYPQAVAIAGRALVQAGGERSEMLKLAGNGASRAAFLLGCCAEELVAAGCSLKGRAERRYVGEVVAQLQPLVRPIPKRQVGPALRRLIAAYAAHSVRLRVRTIDYMLEVNGLAAARSILESDPSCQLQVECIVTVDGITGCLTEMMGQACPLPIPEPAH